MVMVLKKGQQKAPNRMLAKIRRHVANPQPSLGIAPVEVAAGTLGEGSRVLRVPSLMLLRDGFVVVPRMKVGCVEQIAMRINEIGTERNGLAERRDRLIQSTTLLE